jgi:hypothetical protein
MSKITATGGEPGSIPGASTLKGNGMRDEYEDEMSRFHAMNQKPERQSDWLLDVSCKPYLFIPMDGDAIIFESSVLSDRCPGRLLDVYHSGGEKLAHQWKIKNPTWHEDNRRSAR